MSHRITDNFTVPAGSDERLQAMLALYKAPATIRSTKQVFFYANVEANMTKQPPLDLLYNISDLAATNNSLYFAPIGTTRSLNIVDKINDLIDIRVPKDKYMVEIDLVECVIESDPENWQAIPDRVVRRTGPGAFNIEDTFKFGETLSNPDGSTPPRQTINSILQQAKKASRPQTLYLRIKELANGEPFNWSVTNSGAYSIDKSHQQLVRHGDINYANLTLEFGHLVFTGYDQDYYRQSTDPNSNSIPYRTEVEGGGVPKLQTLKNRYNNYRYEDYNSEHFNVVTKPAGATGNLYPDDEYPEFYKGVGGIDYLVQDQIDVTATNYVQPASRAPFVHDPTATPPYNLQGKPLLYNQQAAKIGFRFMIRIINLF